MNVKSTSSSGEGDSFALCRSQGQLRESLHPAESHDWYLDLIFTRTRSFQVDRAPLRAE